MAKTLKGSNGFSYKTCGNCDSINVSTARKCCNCHERPCWHKPTQEQLDAYFAERLAHNARLSATLKSLGFNL